MNRLKSIYWRQLALPGIALAAYYGGWPWALLVAVSSARFEFFND